MAEHISGLPVAVQLYTLRTLTGGLDDTLAKVAAAGYTAVETVGDHGLSADDLGELLAKHGLQVISTHLQLDAFRERTSEMIAFNKALGNDMLVVPYIPALRDETRAEVYQEYGRILGDLARQCQAEGAQLLYHNHNWEMVTINGRLAIDLLFESAGPDLGFEPDLAWIAAADMDPAMLLRRYTGRCLRVHVKDLAPKGERPEDALFNGIVMADVGAGTLDWPTLLAAAKDAGAKWYIVEHDNPRDPVASISRSIAYLRGI
jgi:sugar phosphate isomerase/epimerase